MLSRPRIQSEFCFLQRPVKKLDDGARTMELTKQTSSAGSSQDDALTGVLQKLTPRSHVLNALQLIIDTHSLVSVSDHAGHIIYANDRFCEVSKYSREELIGATHRIVKSGHHPASFYDELWEAKCRGSARVTKLTMPELLSVTSQGRIHRL